MTVASSSWRYLSAERKTTTYPIQAILQELHIWLNVCLSFPCFFPSLFLLSAFSTIPVSWLSCASMYIIRALASSAFAGPAVCE